MARYVIDTGILLGYLRASSYALFVDKQYFQQCRGSSKIC